jgi:hypothetical protein
MWVSADCHDFLLLSALGTLRLWANLVPRLILPCIPAVNGLDVTSGTATQSLRN